MGGLARGALQDAIVWTGAVDASFGVGAFGVGVTVMLALVASDGLADVLADSNLVTEHEHVLL